MVLPSLMKVAAGDRVALQCGARPSPALALQEIVWYRDGQRLPVARLPPKSLLELSLTAFCFLGRAVRATIDLVKKEN